MRGCLPRQEKVFDAAFSWFYRVDELPVDRWSVGRTTIEALAAGMLTFVLLDPVTHAIGACSQ